MLYSQLAKLFNLLPCVDIIVNDKSLTIEFIGEMENEKAIYKSFQLVNSIFPNIVGYDYYNMKVVSYIFNQNT